MANPIQALRQRAVTREAAVSTLVTKLAYLKTRLEALNDLDNYLADLANAAVHVDDEGKASLGGVGATIARVCSESRNRIYMMQHGNYGLSIFLAEFEALRDSMKDHK